MAFVPMVTNVQDFVVNCEKALITPANKVFADEMKIPEEEYVGIERDKKRK